MRDIVCRQTYLLPAELAAKVRHYAGASLSPATLESYQSCFALFTTWCDRHGRATIPATGETMALFLADIADRYRSKTINGILSGIAHAHRAAGVPFDRATFDMVLRGIRRTYGTPSRESAPLTVVELRAVVLVLPDTTCGVRDRALLTLGFAGALRALELTRLDIGAPAPEGRGLIEIDEAGVRISVRRAQADQSPIIKVVPRGGSPCPVEALERWLARANITRGPIFRRITGKGTLTTRRTHPDTVSKIVKQAVFLSSVQAGLSPEAARMRANRFCGHSLRAGFVMSAVMAGASDESIARHVGWVDTTMMAHYRRTGRLFKKHPVQQVLSS